jgi:hypothetical protein
MPTDEQIRDAIANPEKYVNRDLDEIIRDAHALQMEVRGGGVTKPVYTIRDAYRAVTAQEPPVYHGAGSGGPVKLDPKFEAGLVAGYAAGYAAARKELSDQVDKAYSRTDYDRDNRLEDALAGILEDFITPEEGEESSDELGGEGG